MKSNKELMAMLEDVMDRLEISKGPELMPVMDYTTGKQHAELRNYRKKMVRFFKSFSYDRKLEELAGLEQRYQERLEAQTVKAAAEPTTPTSTEETV